MNVTFLPFYDVDSIRKDFPILSSKIYGNHLVYLDNAASAQKPQVVLDSIQNAYASSYANVHRGLHFLSQQSTQLYENARAIVQKFIQAQSLEEIIFTSGATAAINLVAYGYGLPFIHEGDEILLSVMEHHSNIVPWHFLRERKGAKLVWLPVDEHGFFSLEDFEKRLSSRTKLVALTHMSNVLGTIVPVKEVIALCHQRDIPVLIDGSQAIVHMSVDVCALDCDFYVFTGHKMYGPSGIGVLYGKKDMLQKLSPFHGGGEMIQQVTQEKVTYQELPFRFEAGTPPIVSAIGLGSALTYLEEIGRENILHYEKKILSYAQDGLSKIKGLRILGESVEKGPIISFSMQDIHSYDVSMFLDQQGIAMRSGTHCAQPLLEHLGLSSACRVSFGLYNTYKEVDILVQAIESAVDFFKV